ncbi:hypothetical protein D9613_012625 [Agrocybe pediades]|uniref:Uncharacterized protein n=1 Tax=Agrocybe pediades TaxID=84607 RepID=A0A8H4VSX7_9AGAR|nr:hypothetical protein D9613_012625 [Agrocybe pediades]
MSNPIPARGSFNVATRPSTIAELAEKVRMIVKTLDDSRDFEHYLRQTHRHHRKWKDFAQIGDIENAFVELGRAATFVLEKLPTHRDYSTFLDENQRHNLVLNGQVMLDNMTALKLRIVDRYNKWLSEHPDHADHERTPSAQNQCKPDVVLRQQEVEKEQHRLIEEEATMWKPQRHQMEEAEKSRRDESPHNPTPARGSFNVAARPSTIAELAEKVAMIETWDDSRDFEHYLRQAHRHHRKWKDFAQIGDIENAFVELERAATFVLEKLPTHRDYSIFLDENQRHCLTLNGQVMLDNMSALKLRIVDRYDKWLSEHPDHADQERTPTEGGERATQVNRRGGYDVEITTPAKGGSRGGRRDESPLLKTPSSIVDSLCATCGSSVGSVSPLSIDIRDDSGSGSPIDSINVRLGEPPGLWRNYPTAQAQVYPPIIGPNYPYQPPVPQLCCYACISRGTLMAPSNAYYNSGNVYETTVENVGNVTLNYHYYLNGLMSDPPMEDEVYSENSSDAHDQKHDTVISNTSWRNTI